MSLPPSADSSAPPSPPGAPLDEIEMKIAAAFRKVLRREQIGRDDDFYRVGGDSISAVELEMQLENLFGSNVPEVLENTTVTGLAEAIRRQCAQPAQDRREMPVLLPRRAEGTPPILFLVHGRRGQAHIGSQILDLIGPEQPLYVFQARGVDGVQEPHRTIDAMAADYVSAMKKVQDRGPYFVGGLCSGGYVALKMAQILRASGDAVGPLLLIDPPVPPLTPQDAAENLRILDSGLRVQQQRGNIDIDFSNPLRRQGARAVAESFEKALVENQPVPYEGPAYLLACRQKMGPSGWGDPSKLRSLFSGKVECLEVGERHLEIFDASNPAFAHHLSQCVRHARAAMAASSPSPSSSSS